MEDSAYTALYTGTYVMVFIIALTTTLYLFNNIVNYADLAYEFDETVTDSSVILNAPTNENQILTSYDVVSYYYNYIANDLSAGVKLDDTYNLKIYYSTAKDQNKEIKLTTDNKGNLNILSYSELMQKLGNDKKYIFRYESEGKDGVANCVILQATDEQIKALY